MGEDQGPLLIADGGRLGAVLVGDRGSLLNVVDQIAPGGGEAFVGLGFRTALQQGLHDTGSGNLLAASVEDLLLQLGNQGLSLAAELNRELGHRVSLVVS